MSFFKFKTCIRYTFVPTYYFIYFHPRRVENVDNRKRVWLKIITSSFTRSPKVHIEIEKYREHVVHYVLYVTTI